MSDNLISREALKKAIWDESYSITTFNECGTQDVSFGLTVTEIEQIIDNAPTVEPDVNCSHCDYFKFSQAFIENLVEFMTDYNIETVEDLIKELNHINELLGGENE